MQSKELEEHLTEIMMPYQVDIIRGGGVSDGYIEVRPSGVSKGLFLEHILVSLQSINDQLDFVMAVGDDATDEPMFEQLCRLEASDSISAWGITVGKKPSLAQSYVDDPNSVLDLLLNLVKLSQRDRAFSSVDLSESSVDSLRSHERLRRADDKCVMSKSTSDNSLFRQNFTSTHSILPGQLQRGSKVVDDHMSSFPRNISLVDKTMKQYLDSIDEVKNNEDASGDATGGDNDDTGDGLFF